MSHRSHDAGGRGDRQWTRLKPAQNFTGRLAIALGVGVLWELLVLATVARFVHGAVGAIVLVGLLLAGLVPFYFALRAGLVLRILEDARVSIDKAELFLGLEFKCKVEQRARRGLQIKDMKVGLICEEVGMHPLSGGRQVVRTVPLLEKWEALTRDKQVDHARMLSATRPFRVPLEQPASTPIGEAGPPLVRWKLRVVTTPVNSPPYDVDFPVRVHATPSQGFWEEMNSDGAAPIRPA